MTKLICAVLLNQMCRYGRVLVFSPRFRCCSPARFINKYLSTIHQREPFWLAIIDKAQLEKNQMQSQAVNQRANKASVMWRNLSCVSAQVALLCATVTSPADGATLQRLLWTGLVNDVSGHQQRRPIPRNKQKQCFAHAGSVASRPVPAAMLPWCLECVSGFGQRSRV